MNKVMNVKSITEKFLKELAIFGKGKSVKKEKIEKMKFACDAGRFLSQGENLWRENKFEEADIKFREGRDFIKENSHILNKSKNSIQYSVVELLSHDLKFLSEAVLFDKEFQGIFQAKNFKELKIRLNFLRDFLSKNTSKKVAHYPPLQAVFVMKMKYLIMLTEALLFESFGDINYKKSTEKSFHTFHKIDFKKAKQSLKAIEDFLTELKKKVLEYKGLMFIPPDEETKLMKVLQDGHSKFQRGGDRELKAEKDAYRVWYKCSTPKGEPLDEEEKEDEIANAKKYELLIAREVTRTQTFLKGNKSRSTSGKLSYRILSYILKHKGSGGTAWNIAKHIWDVEEVEKFKDLREMAKAVKLQPRLQQAEMELAADNAKGEVERVSKLVRRRIEDLNKIFLKKLCAKLKANEMGEYELVPLIDYCLIEKI